MATVNMDVLPDTTTSRNGHAASAVAGSARTAETDSAERNSAALSLLESVLAAPLDGKSLVRRHQTEIWRYVRFLGCDDSLADDVVQETFLSVLKKPPTSTELAAVRSYLRTVARNTFLALLRKTSRRSEFDFDLAEQVWAETHPRDGGDERLAALDDCLAALEGRAKQAIDLAYRENQSRADIAAAMELTEDGVKSLLRRTREVLRQCVERKTNAGEA